MNAQKNSGTMKQDCENHERCMQMIQAVLDGSASSEELETIRKNLEICLPCVEGYELEKSIKTALQGKVEKKCCPQNTINKIKERLGFSAFLLLLIAAQFKVLEYILEN